MRGRQCRVVERVVAQYRRNLPSRTVHLVRRSLKSVPLFPIQFFGEIVRHKIAFQFRSFRRDSYRPKIAFQSQTAWHHSRNQYSCDIQQTTLSSADTILAARAGRDHVTDASCSQHLLLSFSTSTDILFRWCSCPEDRLLFLLPFSVPPPKTNPPPSDQYHV